MTDVRGKGGDYRRGRRASATFGATLGALAGLLSVSLGLPGLFPGNAGPVAAVALLILAGSIAGWIGLGRWAGLVVPSLLLTIAALVATTPLMSALAHRWVRDDAATGTTQQAIIVLSGGANDDRTLGPAAVDRLLEGLQLWKQGRAPRLITTRETVSERGETFTTDYGQRQLIRLVGAESAWTVVPEVTTTRDEAVHAAEVLLPDSVRRIFVVTSALHSRRACAAFERVGFSVACVVAPGASAGLRNPRSVDQRMMAFRELMHEVLGMLRYRASGWV